MSAPTQPGWWWRDEPAWGRECVRVFMFDGVPWWQPSGGVRRRAVVDDGMWLCEVPTPERIAADAERLERYADALTRIEGGDFPIDDAAELRRIAWRANMGVSE